MKRFKHGNIVQLNDEGLNLCDPVISIATGVVQYYEAGTGKVVVLFNDKQCQACPESWLELLFD
jgi:hypothetical protein